MPDGILLIDKPKGWTSFDVVAKVRGQIREELRTKDLGLGTHSRKVKVGHSGTLDPSATGLLVLAIGSYTKRIAELTKVDKTYEVTMRLGETSTTGDAEGIISNKQEAKGKKPSKEELAEAVQQFVGDIMQTPPAYSAIKVNGQRAYKLARQGKEVKLEPRKVSVYQISSIKYSYPKVSFTARVSSGTYIRSLVEDIGTTLGTGAYMSDLRRTRVGEFSIENAQPPTDVDSSKLLTI